jgi:hypothetical protein
LPVFDAEDDRRLLEPSCLKGAQRPWELGQPPQKPARAVRVHVVFTRRLSALATASRWPCEREATGGESVGWQRWRRQRLAQTRAKVSGFAQGADGIVHLAEYALLAGVQRQECPPGIGTRQDVLTKYGLMTRRCRVCRNLSRGGHM